MTKRNSTASGTLPQKPERPEGSPLFWHQTGRWAKKIKGRLVYFGRGDHASALAEYERQKDDLHSGRRHRDEQDVGLTVFSLCAKFLATKVALRDAGELSPHTINDYSAVCKLLISKFGKQRPVSDLQPDDFEALRKSMAKKWGLVRVGNTINKVRIVFNYAEKNGLVDRRMVYGEGFKRPNKKAIRKHRQAKGPRMFEAAEVRQMLDAAGTGLRAMLLLAINGGLGNSDIANMPTEAVNLDAGWIDYPRVKTAIERKVPLWTETVNAIRGWLAVRPEPTKKEHRHLLFITKQRGSWAKETTDNPISNEVAKLLKDLGINGHRNFYCLRHTFQTIGDESRDFLAVRKIMGHASNDIADAYRERVSDERLRGVVDHVHSWLYPRPTVLL